MPARAGMDQPTHPATANSVRSTVSFDLTATDSPVTCWHNGVMIASALARCCYLAVRSAPPASRWPALLHCWGYRHSCPAGARLPRGLTSPPAVPTVMSLAGRTSCDAERPNTIGTVATVPCLSFLLSPPVVDTIAGEGNFSTALCVAATGELLVAGSSRLGWTRHQPQQAGLAGAHQ
jgi:hypothetical protein